MGIYPKNQLTNKLQQYIALILTLYLVERAKLPSSGERHLHTDHHPECHDGRTHPEDNSSRGIHRGEPGPGHGP